MMHVMARLYMLFFALEVLLLVLALISCLSAEEGEVRALPRIVWVILILLFPLVGSIVYFAVGRPLTTTPRQEVWRPGNGFPEATRPQRTVAPDDDPEFLRRLDGQTRRDDAELLRRWEEDLKRRENDLRKREDTPPSDG
jgi:Phospholipase_D-nuclease N-terminal